MEAYVGQVGVVIEIATGQDLSEATLTRFNVTKPDGTSTTWAATPSDTQLSYTTDDDDLDQSGVYLVGAYVEWGAASKHPGDLCILYVRPAGYDVASYSGDPANRVIDAIRLEIDKTKSLALLTDAEITYAYSQGAGNVLLAAAYCCDKIVAQLSSTDYVDRSMAGSSVSLSQLIEWWTRKAEELRRRAMNPSITPRFSASGSRNLKFGIGQHDYYPGVTDSNESINTDWRSI